MKNIRKLAVVQLICILLTTPLFTQSNADSCHPCDEIHRMDSTHIVIWHSGVQASHLHAEDIKGVSFAPVSNLLSAIPQLNLISTGNSIQKPMFQGLSGLRLPLIQNELRMVGQTWGNDHGPELARAGVESVNVLKAQDALWVTGESWGNAVQVEYQPTYHSHAGNLQSGLGYSSNGNALVANFKLNQGTHHAGMGWYLQGQGFVSQDYSVPLSNDAQTGSIKTSPGTKNGILRNTASQEFSIMGGLTQRLNEHWAMQSDFSWFFNENGIYAGSHIGNTTDLVNSINRKDPNVLIPSGSYQINKPKQAAEHISASAVIQRHDGLKTQISFQQNTRQEFDPHRNPKNSFPQLNVRLNSVQVRQEIPIHLSLISQAQVGSEWQEQSYGGYFLVPEFTSQQYFGVLKGHNERPNLLQNWALRLDFLHRNTLLKDESMNEQTFKGISAAYSARKIQNRNTVQLFINHSWRAPAVNELFSAGVHHGNASYEEGNAGLTPEWGEKLEFQWKKSFKKSNFELSTFGLWSPNYIHLNPQSSPILTVRGAFPHYKYEQLPTILSGASAYQEFFFSRGKFTLGGEYTYGRILQPERYPTLLPCSELSVGWVGQFKFGEYYIKYVRVFQQRYFTASTDLMPPPEGFQLLDAGITLKKGSKYELTLNANNLLNTRSRNYLDRFRYFTPAMGRNIGLKLNINIHYHEKIHP